MGQTWSGVDVSSLVTANERVRADSEPPTSTAGGHAVSRIPEEEEVNLRTSDIQYADWKKSSGILKEKSVQQPKRSRSMSLATAHLSDFSMFPDKYDSMPIRTPDNDAQAQTATPPSTPLSNLTAATAEWLFRNRYCHATKWLQLEKQNFRSSTRGIIRQHFFGKQQLNFTMKPMYLL